jgi:glucose-1-phosphate cytidylyltransferase
MTKGTIEVSESMSGLTAVILCGGKGERLKPFTDHLPKALVPLGGKPLLYHLMNYLSQSGIARFVLCVGYKAECIQQFVHEQAQRCWTVECVNSGDASMADRLLDAQPQVPGRALICYGDILANVDIAALERQHRAAGALATMTVYPLHSPFGSMRPTKSPSFPKSRCCRIGSTSASCYASRAHFSSSGRSRT